MDKIIGCDFLRKKFKKILKNHKKTLDKGLYILYNMSCVTATRRMLCKHITWVSVRTICDEAGGCRLCVGEFPWSMSDFKPGDKKYCTPMCVGVCDELRPTGFVIKRKLSVNATFARVRRYLRLLYIINNRG